MKGIILAGGKATRLYPITKGVCKQLLPVYDKPMIYYPLSVLMFAGIRDILIISTAREIPQFKALFGDGNDLGINISYAVQAQPRGIADALIIGEKFIAKDSICLILGDNIFFGNGLPDMLKEAACLRQGAVIFGYYVKDPERYGVIEFNDSGKVVSIEEKPKKPRSNYAISGLYFYDNDAVKIAQKVKPSKRGELEITSVNNEYLKRGSLRVKLMGRGYAWLDTGTYDSLIDASLFIKTIEERQGLKIGCIEEVAYRMGYIDRAGLKRISRQVNENYGKYLRGILQDEG